MLLILSCVVTLYFLCFLWFRSLCRAAIRSYESTQARTQPTNLIPFERGLDRIHKTPHAV